jgi:AraC-like DNA-binding protein
VRVPSQLTSAVIGMAKRPSNSAQRPTNEPVPLVASRGMLERDAVSIQSACSRIGYEDVAFFRSLFKRHTA